MSYEKDWKGKSKLKTTEGHFELYKSSVLHWLEYFGIKDWQVSFRHRQINEDVRAQVAYRATGRICTFSFNRTWNDWEITDEDVDRCGFHEVCELMFADINCMLEGKLSYYPDTVIEQVHRIIRILENTVFIGKKKGK